jgi:hypothetical protein
VMKTIVDILRREWREIKEEEVEVQGHRSIGPRGGTTVHDSNITTVGFLEVAG